MPTNIYIGNLPFSVTVEEVRDLFETHGVVESVKAARAIVTTFSHSGKYVRCLGLLHQN